MKKVINIIINNEWYFTHDGKTVITIPIFVDESTSVIIGELVKVESFSTENDCYDRIKELKLVITKE